MRRRTLLAAAIPAVAFTFACRDSTGVDAGIPPAPAPAADAAHVLGTYVCSVQVHPAALSCREPGAEARSAGPRAALLGQNQVKLRSSNVRYDSVTQIFGFDVTVQNLLTVAIGTPDGTTVEGMKAYFDVGPSVTAYRSPGDTGSVTVANADGRLDFTAAKQPYFFYNQILQNLAITPVKRWELRAGPQISSFSFILKVFTSTSTEYRVPATAPDTVPGTLYSDPANILTNSPNFDLSNRVLKGIVSLRFKSTAIRDERQAAVDLVHGQVIGGNGIPGGEGYYLVRVADDSLGQGLATAIETLNTLPQVSSAAPEYLWTPQEVETWMHPEDADDWASPWRIDPALADGKNWALEAVSAPRAWGCTTGLVATKVAVVDIGFFSQQDLVANTVYAPAMDAYAAWRFTEDGHGTSTATLLAARGNNGTGIAGVMWNASLSLYDVSVGNDGNVNASLFGSGRPIKTLTERRIAEAINGGADVINVSLALPAGKRTPRAAAEIVGQMTDLANTIKGLPNKPLIVLGAGNDAVDAFWGALPVLAALLPDQVIVVGGTDDASGHMWANTNQNTGDASLPFTGLVQIAAPAKAVGALDDDGIDTFDGTSMSAPIVSGIAGLLKSFDPRLTAAELKQYLLDGARSSGHHLPMGGDVWAADAYQSLIAAASRAGAPLCGGAPVWQDPNGAVFTRRVYGSTVGPLETLFVQAGTDLVPMHGETTIHVDQSYWGWFMGSWAPYPVARTDPFGNATNQSKLGRTHDGQSTATVDRVEVSDTSETYRVYVNGTLLAQVPSTYAKSPPTSVCVDWDSSTCYQTFSSWYDRVTTTPAVAFSPDSSEVVLAISKERSSNWADNPHLCPGGGSEYCMDYGLDVNTQASELVFIGVKDGQIRERRAGPIKRILRLGYSEDNQRLVFQTQYTFFTSSTSDGQFNQTKTAYCDGQYMTRSGTALFSLPLKLNTTGCYASATFSP